jgi:hypothetical protein
MQDTLESLSTLKRVFSEEENAMETVDREMRLVHEWIAETDPPEPKVSPRSLGTAEPSKEMRGSRSIFDDIADDVS